MLTKCVENKQNVLCTFIEVWHTLWFSEPHEHHSCTIFKITMRSIYIVRLAMLHTFFKIQIERLGLIYSAVLEKGNHMVHLLFKLGRVAQLATDPSGLNATPC